MASVSHEMEALRLIPFGELPAAENKAELATSGKQRCQGLAECIRCGDGIVDLHFSVRFDVQELGRSPADCP